MRPHIEHWLKMCIPVGTRWRLFLWAKRTGRMRFATWLLIDRRPLSPEVVEYGQRLWEKMLVDHQGESVLVEAQSGDRIRILPGCDCLWCSRTRIALTPSSPGQVT